jgi:uncharacterized membrane protein YfcA
LRFVSLDWAAAASMLVFAVVGLVAGLALAPRMQGDHLKRALAVLLVAIGLGIGIANLAAMA